VHGEKKKVAIGGLQEDEKEGTEGVVRTALESKLLEGEERETSVVVQTGKTDGWFENG